MIVTGASSSVVGFGARFAGVPARGRLEGIGVPFALDLRFFRVFIKGVSVGAAGGGEGVGERPRRGMVVVCVVVVGMLAIAASFSCAGDV